VVLAVLLRRILGARILDREAAASILRIVLGALMMGAGVLGARLAFPPAQGWTAHLVLLSVSCALGVAAFIGAMWALHSHELRWLIRTG
jgi:hypothetical protein